MNPWNFGDSERNKILEQAKELGPEKIMAVQEEWPKLIARAKAYKESGKDPKDLEVQELAKRWIELVDSFTGGDKGVHDGLTKMYTESGGALKSRFGSKIPDLDVIEYILKALK